MYQYKLWQEHTVMQVVSNQNNELEKSEDKQLFFRGYTQRSAVQESCVCRRKISARPSTLTGHCSEGCWFQTHLVTKS